MSETIQEKTEKEQREEFTAKMLSLVEERPADKKLPDDMWVINNNIHRAIKNPKYLSKLQGFRAHPTEDLRKNFKFEGIA